jgi:hypothetical protein
MSLASEFDQNRRFSTLRFASELLPYFGCALGPKTPARLFRVTLELQSNVYAELVLQLHQSLQETRYCSSQVTAGICWILGWPGIETIDHDAR